MNAYRVLTLVCAGALCAVVSCSSSDGNNSSDAAVDAVVHADLYPDLGLAPDLGQKEPCAGEWIDAIHAQDKVTTGAVATSDVGGGVKQTEIDASAGGMNEAHNNPYVYISLADGSRVDVTDIAAKTSTDWDIAFRRSVIRVNGGDSGAGQGAVAIIPNKTLEDVTAAPAAGAFATDDFLDESCEIKRDAINNILTAFGGADGLWYEYDVNTSKLKPKPAVYVVRRADGSLVKLVIDSYYDSQDQGAHYTIRWSPL